MIQRNTIEDQLKYTLETIDLPNLGDKIAGKVRDCYVLKGKNGASDRRVLVASDRLSAFDRVLTTIPFKGQLLNGMASHWFSLTKDIVPNHIIDQPHPNVFVCQEVEILPVEVVVRGYLTGSAWRDYEAGRSVSGVELAPGLRKSERFESPIITPSTKAERGEHDEPISCEEVVSSGLVDGKRWEEVCETALQLFSFGAQKAMEQGLILVDTKYEFGLLGGKLILADEVHTQDSSRYWMAESYLERFEQGENPEMLDKEFVRDWLISKGYMGDGTPPEFQDSFRVDTAEKYIQAFEKITGKEFEGICGPAEEAIAAALKAV